MPKKTNIDFSKLAEYSKNRPSEVPAGIDADRRWMLQLPDGATSGPFSENELQNFAVQGRFDITAMLQHPVRTNGQWVAIGRFSYLRELIVESAKSRALTGVENAQYPSLVSGQGGFRLKNASAPATTAKLRINGNVNKKSKSVFPSILGTVLVPVSALFTALVFVYLVRPDIIETIVAKYSGGADVAGETVVDEKMDLDTGRGNDKSNRSSVSQLNAHSASQQSGNEKTSSQIADRSLNVAREETVQLYANQPLVPDSSRARDLPNSDKNDDESKRDDTDGETPDPMYASNWPFVRESVRSYSEELAKIVTDTELTTLAKEAASVKAKAVLIKKLSARGLDFHFVLKDLKFEGSKLILLVGASEIELAHKLAERISIPVASANKKLVSAQAGSVIRVSASINKVTRAAIATTEVVFNPADFLSAKTVSKIAKARGLDVGGNHDLITIPIAIDDIKVLDSPESDKLQSWLTHEKMGETLYLQRLD